MSKDQYSSMMAYNNSKLYNVITALVGFLSVKSKLGYNTIGQNGTTSGITFFFVSLTMTWTSLIGESKIY